MESFQWWAACDDAVYRLAKKPDRGCDQDPPTAMVGGKKPRGGLRGNDREVTEIVAEKAGEQCRASRYEYSDVLKPGVRVSHAS